MDKLRATRKKNFVHETGDARGALTARATEVFCVERSRTGDQAQVFCMPMQAAQNRLHCLRKAEADASRGLSRFEGFCKRAFAPKLNRFVQSYAHHVIESFQFPHTGGIYAGF